MGLAYGACDGPDDAYARRITYLIGPDGRIEHVDEPEDPGAQAEALLRQLMTPSG